MEVEGGFGDIDYIDESMIQYRGYHVVGLNIDTSKDMTKEIEFLTSIGEWVEDVMYVHAKRFKKGNMDHVNEVLPIINQVVEECADAIMYRLYHDDKVKVDLSLDIIKPRGTVGPYGEERPEEYLIRCTYY